MENIYTNRQCSICGNTDIKEIFSVTEKQLGLNESFVYFKCPGCGCLEIEEIPRDMNKYYPYDTYYSMSLSSRGGFIRRLNALRYNHRIRSIDGWDGSFSYLAGAFVETFLPLDKAYFLSFGLIKKQDRILDVGSGIGELLFYMKEQGFENVSGVDLYLNNDIIYSNGLKIKKGEIFDIPAEEVFDVIMFNHSLEHIEYPEVTLKAARDLLSPNGIVIVRIPVCYYAWERFKENWWQIDAPRHFWLPTIESIKILATNSGLEVAESIFDSSYAQFMISRQYEKNIYMSDKRSYSRNVIKSLFSFPIIKYYMHLARKLNIEKKGDQCVFVLRKSIQDNA